MLKSLEKRPLCDSGLSVTFMGFGALEIGRDWGITDDTAKPSEEESAKVLNFVLDSGINIIDTARAYHRSEERIGKFIAERRREFILMSKCGEHSQEPETYYDFSYHAVSQSIQKSLELLHTDVIDVMQIHFGPNPEKVLADGETLQALKDARKQGKIRFIGASIDGDLARQCILSENFDCMQMEYNLLNRVNEENIALCKDRNMSVFIRGGLMKGFLTEKGIQQINKLPEQQQIKLRYLYDLASNDPRRLTALALQFLYKNKAITSVLLGSKNIENIRSNLQLLDLDIPENIKENAFNIL